MDIAIPGPDTYAPSYTPAATSGAGAVVALVEERKEAKHTSIGSISILVLILFLPSKMHACYPHVGLVKWPLCLNITITGNNFCFHQYSLPN